MKYYHVYTEAPHASTFTPLAPGMTFLVGGKLNPYSLRNANSATRLAPGISSSDITSSYISMLRELVFENVRLSYFPDKPSRKTCLWVTNDLNVAKYWMGRLPHQGKKKIFELELVDGQVHETWEDYLTTKMENIAELEVRAESYWRGEQPAQSQGEREIMLSGIVKIVREV